MNILLSTIGRRSYLATYFKELQNEGESLIGTTDRASIDTGYPVGALHCDECVLVPSILQPDYVPELLRLCRTRRIGMLTSLYDLDCFVLSKHIDSFRELGVAALISSREVNEVCFDKLKSYDFLRRHGFAVPETIEASDVMEVSGLQLPVMVKPRWGAASLGVRVVQSAAELRSLADVGPDLLVQRRIEGIEYGLDILNDWNGRTLACVVKRKIQMRAGETDQAITVHAPQLLDLGVNLAQALKHVGPLDVDVIVDDHAAYVIDMNPRLGGGYPLSHAAGADFPRLMLALARGEHLQPRIGTYASDVVMLKEQRPRFENLKSLSTVFRSV